MVTSLQELEEITLQALADISQVELEVALAAIALQEIILQEVAEVVLEVTLQVEAHQEAVQEEDKTYF